MIFGPQSHPRLRWPLEVMPLNKTAYLLRDPNGVAEHSLTIPSATMAIVARFDGNHSISEIAREARAFGITEEIVGNLASQLSDYLFLEDSKSNARWQEMQDEFRREPVRRAAHAGLVYPADAGDLQRTISRYISEAGGTVRDLTKPELDRLVGLMAPHIDYTRGWKTYGSVFKQLQTLKPPDVIILLGTAHQPGKGVFHLTEKSFQTPFGTMQTDAELVRRIATLSGSPKLFDDEILHRREHSLELQLPFLQNLFGQQTALIPILIGSFHEHVLQKREPIEFAEIQDFVGAIAEVVRMLRTSGKRVLFSASVDFAHVGPQFGDPKPLNDEQLRHLEDRDAELFSAILAGNYRQLHAHIAEDNDSRRICGYPSLYTMLAALEQAGISAQGQQTEYRQAADAERNFIVTFGGAIWHESVTGS